jgi:glycosyltransferase involved in cell wall biosynthesis
VYSSADLLLQSSRREWSSLTVMEAMACGCVPILSAIPAFRALTGEGAAGGLFPPGRPDLLADRAALGLPERRAQSRAVAQHFQSRLSFEALAGDLEGHVLDLLAPRVPG